MVEDKSRVVIISHPSFEGGREGVEEAKHFGEMIAQVINDFTKNADMADEELEQLREHVSQFKVLVRKVPHDILYQQPKQLRVVRKK